MAEGYERRQETQSLAAPSVRPATVRGPGVGMPGGPAPQVDPSIQLALGELARFGSAGMQQLIERKKKESYLEGQAMFAQGKTLVELEESGGNYFTKQGWQTMDAQNAGALWAVAQEQKITDADYQMEPEEYRKGMAKSIAELTKGRDKYSSAMVMETANKYLPGLASKQFQKNYEYRKTRTMTSAVDSVATLSAAEIDKPDFLATLSRDGDGPLAKMDDEDYNKVLVGGILKAYENDNPNAHKWAEEAGLTNKLDAAGLGALRNAQSQYQTRKEQAYNEDYILKKTDIMTKASSGKYSLSEALSMVKDLNEETGYRFDMQDAGQVANVVINEQERRKREAEAEAKAAAHKAEAESEAQQYALAYQDYALKNMDLQTKMYNKEISVAEYLRQNADLVMQSGLKFNQGFASAAVGDVAQANQVWMKQEAENAALSQANATGDYTGLSSAETQKAIDMQRFKIFNGAQDAIAEGRGNEQRIMQDANAKWQNYLEQSGLVDAKTKAVFGTFLNGTLIDQKGQVPVNVEKAFAQFVQMYESNPQLAMRHIAGDDSKARVRMMLDHYQEAGNYGGALQSVALVEQNSKQFGIDPAKIMENPVVQAQVQEQVDDLIADNSIGWTDFVFGNTTWKQYISANDESIQRAAEGAKDIMPVAIRNEAMRLKAANPALDMQSAVTSARDNVQARTVFMGGQFIVQPRGLNVYDKMFGAGGMKYANNPAIPNEALYSYLNTHGEALFGEKDLFGESLPDPELLVTLAPGGNGVLVQVRRQQSTLDKAVGRTQTWTAARPIPFSSMGAQWEDQYLHNLQAPSRYRKANGAGQPAEYNYLKSRNQLPQ